MDKILQAQTILFLTSIFTGVVMGALFDLLRIFRKMIKHPNFLVQIEDMLYWIACGFLGFYLFYVCNYADIRPYIFIGIILGALFYFSTFSIVFMKIATAVILFVKKLLHKVFNILMIPVRKLIGLMKIPVRYAKNQTKKAKYNAKVGIRNIERKNYEKAADKRVDKYLKKQ